MYVFESSFWWHQLPYSVKEEPFLSSYFILLITWLCSRFISFDIRSLRIVSNCTTISFHHTARSDALFWKLNLNSSSFLVFEKCLTLKLYEYLLGDSGTGLQHHYSRPCQSINFKHLSLSYMSFWPTHPSHEWPRIVNFGLDQTETNWDQLI